MKKKLGVIGGLGPMASSYFYELLTLQTKAETDQDHIEAIIYSCPSIPDRTAYILGKSKESPSIKIIEAGNALCGLGVSYIVIPCITAHYFYNEISEKVNVPVINILAETVNHLKNRGVANVGVMATNGTVYSSIFQNALNDSEINAILPSVESQDFIMDLVYNNVKANKPVDKDKFYFVSNELKRNGAEVVLIACTELSVIKRDLNIAKKNDYVDALEVLAMRSLQLCGVTTL